MTVDLSTTNLLLGIMAAVSVLEALVIIGIGVAGFMAYSRVMTLLDGLENRQVAPAMARVNSILDDVKGVTTKVKEETDRVRSTVRLKTSRVVAIIRGARVAIDTFLHDHDRFHHDRFEPEPGTPAP